MVVPQFKLLALFAVVQTSIGLNLRSSIQTSLSLKSSNKKYIFTARSHVEDGDNWPSKSGVYSCDVDSQYRCVNASIARLSDGFATNLLPIGGDKVLFNAHGSDKTGVSDVQTIPVATPTDTLVTPDEFLSVFQDYTDGYSHIEALKAVGFDYFNNQLYVLWTGVKENRTTGEKKQRIVVSRLKQEVANCSTPGAAGMNYAVQAYDWLACMEEVSTVFSSDCAENSFPGSCTYVANKPYTLHDPTAGLKILGTDDNGKVKGLVTLQLSKRTRTDDADSTILETMLFENGKTTTVLSHTVGFAIEDRVTEGSWRYGGVDLGTIVATDENNICLSYGDSVKCTKNGFKTTTTVVSPKQVKNTCRKNDKDGYIAGIDIINKDSEDFGVVYGCRLEGGLLVVEKAGANPVTATNLPVSSVIFI